jgi:hypothetical protein
MARKSTTKAEAASTSAPREPTVKSVAPRRAAKTNETEIRAQGAEISDEMIRARAHQLWLNGVPGTELDHWFQARRQLEIELGR